MRPNLPPRKPLRWTGSTHDDLRDMPDEVRQVFGQSLLQAQLGLKADNATPMKGYKGAGVLEVIHDYASDTYRAVYTVRLAGAVYVLHVFQKKSKRGIKTPRADLDLIRARLREAEEDYKLRPVGEERIDGGSR